MMFQKTRLAGMALVAAVSLSAVAMSTDAIAQDKIQDRTQDRDRVQDQIYGSQLMTVRERNEYRVKMRSMHTAEEREAYRLEHHKQMQERAREKGISLPDEPPAQRGGMGAGPGGGMGSGPGGGMGGGPGGGGAGGAGGKN